MAAPQASAEAQVSTAAVALTYDDGQATEFVDAVAAFEPTTQVAGFPLHIREPSNGNW